MLEQLEYLRFSPLLPTHNTKKHVALQIKRAVIPPRKELYAVLVVCRRHRAATTTSCAAITAVAAIAVAVPDVPSHIERGQSGIHGFMQ